MTRPIADHDQVPDDLWPGCGRWLRGWRDKAVAVVATVTMLGLVALHFILPPDLRYRSVNVDGDYGGCYRVYHSPFDAAAMLRQSRDLDPFVLVYEPPAQPVFTSTDLPNDRVVVMVLPNGSLLGPPVVLRAHAGPAFYRQPTRPVGMVIVYYPSYEPPGGLPTTSVVAHGACPVEPVPIAQLAPLPPL